MSELASGTAVRLVALDIDGTLLRSDRTISARTRQALAGVRAAGVRLVLVTGRRYPSARRVAEEIAPAVPLVLHNGALVVEEGRVVRCSPLAREVAQAAILAGRAQGREPVLHCGLAGEGLLVVEEAAHPSGLVRYYLDRSREELRTVPSLLDLLAAEDPIQVMFGGTREEMDPLWRALEPVLAGRARIERTVYPASGVVLLDVVDPRVGKAEALAFLQRRWRVSAEETLAIGDNWNDREMVARAGRGFVMGNADPELLALGLPALPTNDEDGVAQALERHVLGPA